MTTWWFIAGSTGYCVVAGLLWLVLLYRAGQDTGRIQSPVPESPDRLESSFKEDSFFSLCFAIFWPVGMLIWALNRPVAWVQGLFRAIWDAGRKSRGPK